MIDDDEYLNKGVAGLGDIKLVISHATFGASVDSYRTNNPVGKVHERAKKATGHKIGYVLLFMLFLCLTAMSVYKVSVMIRQ